MTGNSSAECRRNSWWVAIAGGVLVMLMLWLVAKYAFFPALLIGALFAAVLGFFLGWAFCSGAQEVQAAQVAAPVAPKTEPAGTNTLEKAAMPEPASPVAPAAPLTSSVETVAAEALAKPAKPAAKPAKPAAKKAKAAKPAARKPAKDEPAPKKAAVAAGLDAALAKSKDVPAPGAPELLDAPRGGKADDLKMIKGVGPKLEGLLNEVGVWHFDQIASWKAKDIAHVDEKMVGFHGRITRDEWVKQAKVLAKGGETEFSKRVTKGGVY